jgi:hypothetical protein
MAIAYLVPTVLNGMVHEGVRVIGCRWIPKIVTTEPPKYIPHTEYSWACELVGEVPLLAALILVNENGLYWKKLGRNSAATTLRIGLSFLPHDWTNSNYVLVSLSQQGQSEPGYVQRSVNDASLKKDPRDFVKLELAVGSLVRTGTLFRLGAVNSLTPLSAGIVLVAQTDTESCRCSRWRIKRRIQVDLPAALSFLNNGRHAGFSDTRNRGCK